MYEVQETIDIPVLNYYSPHSFIYIYPNLNIDTYPILI